MLKSFMRVAIVISIYTISFIILLKLILLINYASYIVYFFELY
jgi:hypothetical protein